MRIAQTVAGLARFEQRGAGTDSERRAASWLTDELNAGGRDAMIEPFWCRPNWALAHAWHLALALVGSLLSVTSPRFGGALVLVALLAMAADVFTGHSPGRLLSFERASQNVICTAPSDDPRVRLIITANYDAGRTSLVYRRPLRLAAARLRALTGELGPGWHGWLAIIFVWLIVTAILRSTGSRGTGIAVAQLIPSVVAVLALALLLELASSSYGPAAADNGSGVAVALALLRALDAGPPSRVAVELVLQGASDGNQGIGLRRHLRRRKGSLGAADVVVLGIAACGAGQPRWWISDGTLIPMRYLRRLRDLSAQVGAAGPHLGATPYRGRGTTPALPARAAGLPAIAIGCLDHDGLVPHSHTPADTPEHLDEDAMGAALAFALELVDGIDAEVGRRADPQAGTTRDP